MAMLRVYQIFGVSFSFFLAFIWTVILCSPSHWLYVSTVIASFQTNIFSVYMEKGTGTWGAEKIACNMGPMMQPACNLITNVTESGASSHHTNMWMSKAKHTFCQVQFACDDWTNVWVGSWVAMMCGAVGIICFITGGLSMGYYAFVHATETGRKMANVFLWLGPFSFVIAVFGFAFMSSEWGTSQVFRMLNAGKTPHAGFGSGFISACIFTIFGFLPAIIMAFFGKENPFEKKHGEDMDGLGELYPAGSTGGYPCGAYGGGYGNYGHHSSTLHSNVRQVEMQMWNTPSLQYSQNNYGGGYR